MGRDRLVRPSSGIEQGTWRLRRVGTGEVVAGASSSRTGSALRSVPHGVGYRLEVEAADRLGHASGPAYSSVVVA